MTREARGFPAVETFIAGQAHSLATASVDVSANSLGGQSGQLDNSDAPHTSLGTPSPWLASGQPSGALAFQPPEEPITQVVEQATEFEPFHSPLARQVLPELQVLRETRQLSDWLSERLQLPEEALLVDPDLEFALLDEIFARE